jgi:hypothetical protein
VLHQRVGAERGGERTRIAGEARVARDRTGADEVRRGVLGVGEQAGDVIVVCGPGSQWRWGR